MAAPIPEASPPVTPRRLLTHLSLSHTVPVLLVIAALALLITAMIRVSMVLAALNETELVTLRDEGSLHSAMWDLDVSMRHAYEDCQKGEDPTEGRAVIQQRAGALKQQMVQSQVAATMLPMAGQYLALADDIEATPGCEGVLANANRRRDKLDENLTNLWVTRLQVLHRAVTGKEEEARRLGRSAMWIGLSLSLGSIVLAVMVARRMARSLSRPLVDLAELARRVGLGDFNSPIVAQGPLEIRTLADELENMRQRLAQLDSLKQGFLASVSHELRTPLSKIREALALMRDGVVGELDPRQERVLEIARQACEREIRMVSTLLDLSRLRSGSPLRPRDGSSIDQVIDGALADEKGDAEGREVRFEVVREGDAPACQLDPVLLERAVANMVRNAVAVSPKGERVLVKRTIQEAGGKLPRRIQITVRDEGPGVPEPIRQIVFDAFVTHAVPQSGKAVGIGLGLALAREIARAHGGDLVLDAATGRGATFHLWLPIVTSWSLDAGGSRAA